ncbi:PP-loop family protein [Babesia ovis]|uniref:Cytoplasmic tRNA 2-thiolation protein 1 n=1 Tax=Babesia ovis TaxID=5869 RepID=A0A9W5T8R5_BABOV|nr:PP-loop family protein [Babesia ovis]
MMCAGCNAASPVLRRSGNRLPYCKRCFIKAFEDEVYEAIQKHKMIVDGDVVCIGVSGGKDSSVLAHVLATLKQRYSRKWTLYLLAADEGIKGYRDDSLHVVKGMRNPNYDGLKILNFKERFGFDMDEVVSLIGQKNNCTVCGTFRRQILEIGARMLGANKLCTGHNIDDNAETVLLNICRNDLFKLAKTLDKTGGVGRTWQPDGVGDSTPSGNTSSADGTKRVEDSPKVDNMVAQLSSSGCQRHNHSVPEYTNGDSETTGPGSTPATGDKTATSSLQHDGTEIIRIKPMMYCFEKEIVMYARYLNLEYFSTECIYAPEAYRGYMRTFIKQLEAVDPRIIQNITQSSQQFYAQYPSNRKLNTCKKCGIEGINDLCKACILVQKLTTLRLQAKKHAETDHNCYYT